MLTLTLSHTQWRLYLRIHSHLMLYHAKSRRHAHSTHTLTYSHSPPQRLESTHICFHSHRQSRGHTHFHPLSHRIEGTFTHSHLLSLVQREGGGYSHSHEHTDSLAQSGRRIHSFTVTLALCVTHTEWRVLEESFSAVATATIVRVALFFSIFRDPTRFTILCTAPIQL